METFTIPSEEIDLLRSLRGKHVDEFWVDQYTCGFLLGNDSVVVHSFSILHEENCRDWYELFRIGFKRERNVDRYQSFMTCVYRRLGNVVGVRVGTSVIAEWPEEREQEIVPRLTRYAARTDALDPDGMLDTYVTHPDCRDDLLLLERADVPVATVPVGIGLELENGFCAVCCSVSLAPMLEGWIVPIKASLFGKSVVNWRVV